MKARMTVNPRLLALLGDKLYSKHPLPIVVRELLQNEEDACKRIGVDPKIYVTIDVKASDDVLVIVKGNGCGMTEEELLNDFLCLGSTSKEGEAGSTGKFGIAKAAIMRNPEWSVRTQDNYLDNTFFEKEEEIAKVPYEEGTEIRVHITRYCYSSDIEDAVNMIYGSDVKVDFTLSRVNNTYNDPVAGMNGELSPYIDNPNFSVSLGTDIVRCFGDPIQGHTFYRLNGLVQFIVGSYNPRKTNIFVDLTPICDASSPSYPFNMAREALTNELHGQVFDITSKLDEAPRSTDIRHSEIKSRKTSGIKIVGSVFMHGDRVHNRKVATHSLSGESHYVVKRDIEPDVERVDSGNDALCILLIDYKKAERNVQKDMRLLTAWRELIRLCASTEESFGVGLKVDAPYEAARHTEDGNTFYIIDPDALEKVDDVGAKIMFLYDLAQHECSHLSVDSHNEDFMMEKAQILLETVDCFLRNFNTYKKILKGELE